MPTDTQVGIPQYAANRSSTNFADPELFIPERFLKEHEERYAKDSKNVVQPFSMGPRNCIGQNLARLEMRLILAKLVWNFDMQLCEEDDSWVTSQKAYGLWDKDPLLVKIVERRA